MRRSVAVIALMTLVATACATSGGDRLEREPQPSRIRAALAAVSVDNRSAENLSIYYRLTTPPATEVRVGTVAAGASAVMAPVPAGEALIFVARTATGAELVLPPRTFALDDEWTWLIAADARFIRPAATGTP